MEDFFKPKKQKPKTTAWLAHTRKELVRYQRFPKLYGEMKFAANFVSNPSSVHSNLSN